ncbi:ECF family RNA polymerase sigma factor [Sorangium cellulosum]|uniref:ECF family RNA polymerase sigma factor n=1 Tax=Sorangium cellulosum TaxID=56 RepID=A0A2L0EMC0_SORCE|nr:RNA polymerase sigma factor [Sorangium cellulosum]AUX40438.1 ECF family RNA polymerase sigma factor [Sorangium cellulosum]
MGTVAPRPASRRLRLVPAPDTEPAAPAPAPAPVNDEELLLAFHRGERGIGLRLYEHLLPVVDRTLYRILGCREQDHADLVQGAFEQIVSTLARRRFAGECSLAGWASVIACHVGLSALRARRRERKVIDRSPGPEVAPEPPARSADPERELRAQRDLEALRRHLAAMDRDRAAALLLHAMGYSLQEIAALTGASVAAAQSRLSRGRRELQARFEPDTTARPDPARPEKLR